MPLNRFAHLLTLQNTRTSDISKYTWSKTQRGMKQLFCTL